jgi:hypothetical protein
MNDMLVGAVREAHAVRPVDWVFFYGGGQDYSPAMLRRLTAELGIPLVNMSLDDKQGFVGHRVGDAHSGAFDITRDTDLFMTSARSACEWHMAEGGRPVYMPEGFDASAYGPRIVERDLDVSFVGGAYGFRFSIVDFLRKHGVNVTTFAAGSIWAWVGSSIRRRSPT